MNEVTAIMITGSGFMIINIVGWLINSRANSKNDGKWEGIVDTKIKGIYDRADSISSDIDKLPCVSDPNYQKNMGSMIQSVSDIVGRVERIEKNMNNKR